MSKKWLLVPIIACVLLLVFFKPEGQSVLRIGDTTISIEVADTNSARERGLSGRESLEWGSGLLFVFDQPGIYGFWMKEMNFSIDIIWIDEEKRIVGVERDISPGSYPQIFRPNKAVKYVLEVPANFSQRQGIDIGQEVYFAY